jgi:RHS repeat-associated protein
VPLYGASRLGSLTHLNDGTAAGLDDYRYELNDHLGDARVVFHRPTTTVDVETMELSGVPGRAAFLNDDRYRVAVSGAPSGDYVARLTDSQPAGQELKRVLSVSKGDTITFSALAQWKQNAAAGGNSTTPFILAGAAAGLAPLSQRGPEGQTAYQTNSPNWLSLLAAGLGFTLGGGNQSASLGSSSLTGWLKYRVLDESGTEQASGRDYLLGTGKWEYLQTGVRIAQAGTIEVMAGTSGSGEAVYFDNLRVEQSGGLIVQEQHQYAYGAPLPGLSYVVGSKRYRYGYQGQYAERDDETGFESFELRLYNSRVGRWLSYDPEGQHDSPYIGMGNNPIINIDPDGGLDGPWGIAAKLHPLAEVTVSGARQGMSTLARLGLQAGSSILRTGEWYGQYTKGFYQGAGAGLHDTGSWAVGLLPGTSRHSWKETGQGFSTLATLSNPYSADGMIMRAQLAASGANYIKNVPNMNPEDFGYDMGYTSEKVAEIWISHKAIPVLKSKIGLPTLGISSKYFSPISKMLKDGPMGKVRIPRVYTPVMRGGRLIMSNNLGTATGKWTTMGVRLVLWPSAGQYLPQSSKGVSGSW